MTDDTHRMPDPERLDALLDGAAPRDDDERDLLAFTAALRDATPPAPADVRTRVIDAARAGQAPARARRRWLPTRLPALAGSLAAVVVVAVVAAALIRGGGGSDVTMAGRDASSAPAEKAPAAQADSAARAGTPAPTVPTVSAAPAAPAPSAPAPSAAPAPAATPSPAPAPVPVTRAQVAAGVPAAMAYLRSRGLVLGVGALRLTAGGGAVFELAVPQGPDAPADLRSGVVAAVRSPASVPGVRPADRAVGVALRDAVTTRSPASRRLLAARLRAVGATVPIAGPPPQVFMFVIR